MKINFFINLLFLFPILALSYNITNCDYIASYDDMADVYKCNQNIETNCQYFSHVILGTVSNSILDLKRKFLMRVQ